MRYILYIFLGIIAASVILTALQILTIYQHVKKMSYDAKPFVRENPTSGLKFFFMGDSTALGIGAKSNTQSIAGYFGQAFPEASIDNDSYNGRKVGQLARAFPQNGKWGYDLVVIQIGANDIMQFTSFRSINRDIRTVITEAKRIGKHVVILHSGNVGLAPLFIWPFSAIMTHRSWIVRHIYKSAAHDNGVLYVDLFTQRSNDPFLKDIPKYYCLDRLHPSGEGYRWWYERIRATLNGAGVVF